MLECSAVDCRDFLSFSWFKKAFPQFATIKAYPPCRNTSFLCRIEDILIIKWKNCIVRLHDWLVIKDFNRAAIIGLCHVFSNGWIHRRLTTPEIFFTVLRSLEQCTSPLSYWMIFREGALFSLPKNQFVDDRHRNYNYTVM